jgi:hypothetical protein
MAGAQIGSVEARSLGVHATTRALPSQLSTINCICCGLEARKRLAQTAIRRYV